MKRRMTTMVLLQLCFAASAFAQDRAAVFIHGLASSPSSWNAAVGRLTPQLAIRPEQADLDWRVAYEQQAAELERELGDVDLVEPFRQRLRRGIGGPATRDGGRNKDSNREDLRECTHRLA